MMAGTGRLIRVIGVVYTIGSPQALGLTSRGLKNRWVMSE